MKNFFSQKRFTNFCLAQKTGSRLLEPDLVPRHSRLSPAKKQGQGEAFECAIGSTKGPTLFEREL
jgi:hypothetical protein